MSFDMLGHGMLLGMLITMDLGRTLMVGCATVSMLIHAVCEN